MKSLRGLTVIMIGGTGGMGSATAKKIAESGATICVCGKRQDRLDLLEADLKAKGATTFFKSVDLADSALVGKFVDECAEKFGRLDILINFAGISLNANLDQMTEAQFDDVMDVNLKGIFFATQAFANHVDESKGAYVINFSSMASKRPGGGNLVYTAAKGAVRTLTEALASQLKSKNIKFTTMSPGPTATTFFEGRKTAEQMSGFMTAEDIADMLEFIMVRSDRLVFHEICVDSWGFFNR